MFRIVLVSLKPITQGVVFQYNKLVAHVKNTRLRKYITIINEKNFTVINAILLATLT